LYHFPVCSPAAELEWWLLKQLVATTVFLLGLELNLGSTLKLGLLASLVDTIELFSLPVEALETFQHEMSPERDIARLWSLEDIPSALAAPEVLIVTLTNEGGSEPFLQFYFSFAVLGVYDRLHAHGVSVCKLRRVGFVRVVPSVLLCVLLCILNADQRATDSHVTPFEAWPLELIPFLR
jgi:hypothetical protein